jgi:hypothetical protein
MNLSDLRKGDHFALDEFGNVTPFIAEENAHSELRDGEHYITLMARNMVSDISIPLSVHIDYPQYLRVTPLYWSDKPNVKLVWNDDK